jgi:ABC-2 type transport system ATP-binding protein
MIQTQQLSFGYSAGRDVLKDINLTLQPGHIYGLLGKNGVGKSTLLKLLTGVLFGRGTCTIDNEVPARRTPEFLRSIRLVHENEAIPALDLRTLRGMTAPFYPTFDGALFDRAIAEFEVPDRQRLNTLSLGQQKKAIISLALACNTPYLFMDEPTNGMDIPSKAAFRRLVGPLFNAERTIVISTHQVDDLETLMDSVVILEQSGVLLNDTLANLGRRFAFGVAGEGDTALYSEPTLRGVMSVMPNRTGEEQPVDMKLLFNAVVTHPELFQKSASSL